MTRRHYATINLQNLVALAAPIIIEQYDTTSMPCAREERTCESADLMHVVSSCDHGRLSQRRSPGARAAAVPTPLVSRSEEAAWVAPNRNAVYFM